MILFADTVPPGPQPGDLARAAAAYALVAAGSIALCASGQSHQQQPRPRFLPAWIPWHPRSPLQDLVTARQLLDRELAHESFHDSLPEPIAVAEIEAAIARTRPLCGGRRGGPPPHASDEAERDADRALAFAAGDDQC